MNQSARIPESWFLPPLDQAVYLTGPTASGKTQIALEVAEHIGAEILSVDSMAVYRGMDIGTAKPTLNERRRIPHHLIDIRNPTDDYSVAEFLSDAHRIAQEIRTRGKRVMLVGGTPLYLKSLLCGFFQGPEADWEFRKAVEEEVAEIGTEQLHRRLAQVDPLSAHRISPNDVRRMTRALEVSKLTGWPLSHWQTQFERFAIPKESHAFVLSWDRSILHQRVASRVESMVNQGLVDEVRGLVDLYGGLGRTASQAVGYKEPIEFLAGKLSFSAMQEQIVIHTRQFVRRQEIWFRSMPTLQRIEMIATATNSSATNQNLKTATETITKAIAHQRYEPTSI